MPRTLSWLITVKTEDNLGPKIRDGASTPEASHTPEPGQAPKVAGTPGCHRRGSRHEGLPLLHAQTDVWKEVGGEWNLGVTFTLFTQKIENREYIILFMV